MYQFASQDDTINSARWRVIESKDVVNSSPSPYIVEDALNATSGLRNLSRGTALGTNFILPRRPSLNQGHNHQTRYIRWDKDLKLMAVTLRNLISQYDITCSSIYQLPWPRTWTTAMCNIHPDPNWFTNRKLCVPQFRWPIKFLCCPGTWWLTNIYIQLYPCDTGNSSECLNTRPDIFKLRSTGLFFLLLEFVWAHWSVVDMPITWDFHV